MLIWIDAKSLFYNLMQRRWDSRPLPYMCLCDGVPVITWMNDSNYVLKYFELIVTVHITNFHYLLFANQALLRL